MSNEDAITEGTSRELSTPNFFHTSVPVTGSISTLFRKHMEFQGIGRTLTPNETTSLEEKKSKKQFLSHS